MSAPLNPSAAPADSIVTDVRLVTDLGPADRDGMYRLLSAHYDNVTRRQFDADLDEKDWVFVIADSDSDTVLGFSTLMCKHTTVDDEPVAAFFSGDTVVDPAHWGRSESARVWLQFVIGQAEARADRHSYWLLVSSSARTYRLLPAMFQEFYPTPHADTPPAMKRRIDTLVRLKFPAQFDEEIGVVRNGGETPVRSERLAGLKLTKPGDPFVTFFETVNPGHIQRDMLACIARVERANLTSLGRRLVGTGPDATAEPV